MGKNRDRVLAAVAAFWLTYGYAPTVRDLTELTGISSTSVTHYWLEKLREEGALTWTEGQTRTIRLLEPVEAADA